MEVKIVSKFTKISIRSNCATRVSLRRILHLMLCMVLKAPSGRCMMKQLSLWLNLSFKAIMELSSLMGKQGAARHTRWWVRAKLNYEASFLQHSSIFTASLMIPTTPRKSFWSDVVTWKFTMKMWGICWVSMLKKSWNLRKMRKNKSMSKN